MPRGKRVLREKPEPTQSAEETKKQTNTRRRKKMDDSEKTTSKKRKQKAQGTSGLKFSVMQVNVRNILHL